MYNIYTVYIDIQEIFWTSSEWGDTLLKEFLKSVYIRIVFDSTCQ